jgi:hypothetical protein
MSDRLELSSTYIYIPHGMITNDARCTREIKSRITMAKAAFKKKKKFSPANWT